MPIYNELKRGGGREKERKELGEKTEGGKRKCSLFYPSQVQSAVEKMIKNEERESEKDSQRECEKRERVEGMETRLRGKRSKPPGLKYNDITGELA